MSARRTTANDPYHPAEIVQWRRDRLAAAGFAAELATELARDQRIDLHAVLDLIDRGCPPALAVRILAPLGDPAQLERRR
jgi:hypothetical protein